MTESFAGITVPSGSVGELRSSAFPSRSSGERAVLGLGQPVGVDRAMCPTCRRLVQNAANYTGQPLLMRDPDHARLFLPGHEHPILDPTPQQFPAARPITTADVHRGLGAGAGAAAATPGARP